MKIITIIEQIELTGMCCVRENLIIIQIILDARKFSCVKICTFTVGQFTGTSSPAVFGDLLSVISVQQLIP